MDPAGVGLSSAPAASGGSGDGDSAEGDMIGVASWTVTTLSASTST